MSSIAVIVQYAMREAMRRKVFAVVIVLTVVFLVLFGSPTTSCSGISPRSRRRPT